MAIAVETSLNVPMDVVLVNRIPEEIVALDFHHLNPSEKDLEVSLLTRYSTKRVKDEIRKCVVLCANCHRKLHAGIISL